MRGQQRLHLDQRRAFQSPQFRTHWGTALAIRRATGLVSLLWSPAAAFDASMLYGAPLLFTSGCSAAVELPRPPSSVAACSMKVSTGKGSIMLLTLNAPRLCLWGFTPPCPPSFRPPPPNQSRAL